MKIREIEFKALAPILKGKNKGKLVWWENVIVGDGSVFIDTPIKVGIHELKDVKVVCEYIGLRDKNGRKIFEGDIIYVDGLYYEVFWDNINACWAAETEAKDLANKLDLDGVFQLNADEEQFYEIVGNIYENSELLNKNQKL